ncbi:farnesyl pyrophosphate synthase-like [Onthophagus taurus]|uniref:farnesyl pyrophosphate synthase-like n=1 Tax=Onthophagus taurus TaxID=166361 RepID=UPI0039BE96B2
MSQVKAVFENTIIKDLVSDPDLSDIPDVVALYKKMLEELVPNGQNLRLMSFLNVYKRMEDNKNLSSERIKLAYILGWCIEMFHGASGAIDDLFDKSEFRRGRKCWYKHEGVNESVLLDLIFIENYVYEIIQKYFSHLKIDRPLINLFQKTVQYLIFAQSLEKSVDYSSQHPNLNKFTRSFYKTLSKYKNTTFIDFPYRSARCLANKYQTKISKEDYNMCLMLAEFSQIQNDFMDCYYNIDNFKTGNDIEEGKCSWLIVTALENATPEQRKLIENHYGRKDAKSVKIIKDLFQELKIPKLYSLCEEEFFYFIDKNVEQVSNIAYHNVLFKRLDFLYKAYL